MSLSNGGILRQQRQRNKFKATVYSDKMEKVFISIGSNINKEKNIRSAIKILANHYHPINFSSIYECLAIGFEGDNFYNLVISFDTKLTAQQLNTALAAIENDHGRDRSAPPFSPRTLDLDLILYGADTINDGGLQIPRNEIIEYAFVLKPLAELVPQNRHPVSKQTFQALWQQFKSEHPEQKLWRVDFDF